MLWQASISDLRREEAPLELTLLIGNSIYIYIATANMG